MNRLLVPIAFGMLVFGAGGCSQGRKSQPDRGPQPVGTGKARITSEPPGAAVIEAGDQRLGRTPVVIERPGLTRLELQLVKDGYQIFRIRRLVEEGRTVRIHCRLQREVGTLIVRSGVIRGARIRVDGEDRGKTPTRVPVPAGQKHVVEVRKSGFEPYVTEATVSAGEIRYLDVGLVPEGRKRGPEGWLSVTSDQPAMVYLGSSPLGSTPLTRVKLPARRYRLTLKNPSLKLKKSVNVVVVRGETAQVQVNLTSRR